uniref:Ankyrin repeat n=1 Tax=Tetraselmis sp. GSL018 TaxID=582737 RepID=A0A061S307_9CHLO|mmetsp:Transcript_42702/g.101381  ORF Transcript_42702/g.101381 Transcript_42702/m.101381 type:complete len:607 (+) Transcript_42702:130-1950(+)|eukprot:CAMPEP_0177608330 /NCGR_PEP_ID=MMETSP0419_2-20121207/18414_1 /TAXON_ID=582737 /ORGANISM="Tetraselmis sp., Strain GSL018" /LENGTH=606 /DNA_ID=CAMNT_0019103013 /DNA_START=61 /DNA_END=1881 /DNA_ORIENTATION=-
MDNLEQAAKRGDQVAVARLVREGADPSEADESGRTPLSWAVEYGHTSVVLFLLEDPNLPLNSADVLGRSPMHYTAAKGHAEALKILLAEGAEPDLRDVNGCTPLHYAAAGAHSQCVKMLLEAPAADVNRVETNLLSPLMLASSVGDAKTVELLLEAGASVNLCDKEGTTALMMACSNSHKEVARLLLGAGALADAENAQGLIARDMVADSDILRMLEQQMAASYFYRGRFSIIASQPCIEMSYGLMEEAHDINKGMMVELRFYASKSARDLMVNRLSVLSADFVANIPVSDRESELGSYVFTDSERHPDAPYCLVLARGELYLEEVLGQASMISFAEMMHIFKSILECVEHLHLNNVAHCNLSSMAFMRFHDGIYRVVDLHDSKQGSEFYSKPRPEEGSLDSLPPELASFFLVGEYSQPVKTSRDIWSLGGILLSMITNDSLISLLSSGVAEGDAPAGMQAQLELLANVKQDDINNICQNILEKSVRSYSIRFPHMQSQGKGGQLLNIASQSSSAVARLVDLIELAKALLSVDARARPTCTQALNSGIFKPLSEQANIKTQELLKLQMSSAQAEARQLALMEEISGNLKMALQDVKQQNHTRSRPA